MSIQTMLAAAFIAVISLCGFPFAGFADDVAEDMTPAASYVANSDPIVLYPSAFERVAVVETPLATSEMQELRGGFMDPTGLIYNFAVNVQTDINGAEVFSRSITVSPSGLNGQLTAATSTNLYPQNLASNLNVNMIGNGNGVVIRDSSGTSTTVLNETANGAPASIVLNTSNNSNVAQTVNLSLVLKNMSTIENMAHLTTQSALGQNAALRSLGLK